MSRQPRRRSASCIYHVILRGVAQMNIFDEEEDYTMFTTMLSEVRTNDTDTGTVTCLVIYAYCLMTNHVHLLVKEVLTDEEKHKLTSMENNRIGISSVMHRLGRKYTMWYNKKYGRTGTLFDDRFKSEPVEDNEYFMTVFRYIHRNPVKANICEGIAQYPWSSWHEYTEPDYPENLCSTHVLLSRYGIEDLTCMCQTAVQKEPMDFEDKKPPLSDRQAKSIMLDISGTDNATDFLKLDKHLRTEHVRQLIESGFQLRQCSRMTGMTVEQIRRACGYKRKITHGDGSSV